MTLPSICHREREGSRERARRNRKVNREREGQRERERARVRVQERERKEEMQRGHRLCSKQSARIVVVRCCFVRIVNNMTSVQRSTSYLYTYPVAATRTKHDPTNVFVTLTVSPLVSDEVEQVCREPGSLLAAGHTVSSCVCVALATRPRPGSLGAGAR